MNEHGRYAGYLAACIAVSSLGSGCGGESQGEDPVPDAGSDVAVHDATPEAQDTDVTGETDTNDVADATPLASLSVVVVLLPPLRWDLTGNEIKVAGVTVAADLPGGERVEATTNQDGEVAFDVDWTEGLAAVTAYLEGYSPTSVLGIGESDEQVVVPLALSDPFSPMLTVSGTALNMVAPNQNALMVVNSTVAGWAVDVGGTYSMSVQPDTPFTLVATEWDGGSPWCAGCPAKEIVGWTRLDHGPVSEDAVVDLDFSQKLTPTQLTVTYELPADPDDSLHDADIAFLSVYAGGLQVGFHTESVLSPADGTFTVHAEYVPWDGDDRIVTACELLVNGVSASTVYLDGYPQDGSLISNFLRQPKLTRPANPTVAAPLQDPIEWELAEAIDFVDIMIVNPTYTGLSWRVFDLDPSGSITLPPLPSNAEPETVIGLGSHDAILNAFEGDYRTGTYSKKSFSPSFKLKL